MSTNDERPLDNDERLGARDADLTEGGAATRDERRGHTLRDADVQGGTGENLEQGQRGDVADDESYERDDRPNYEQGHPGWVDDAGDENEVETGTRLEQGHPGYLDDEGREVRHNWGNDVDAGRRGEREHHVGDRRDAAVDREGSHAADTDLSAEADARPGDAINDQPVGRQSERPGGEAR
ncbi:hypothetical protein [Nigerium massiliense]|uniref:hypothetical protein n=1 Tax=Nigerium massiliense TaxID=1522317 RepID=UPI00058F05CD|nr:hypothetical protein [Nigerium massiliense]